MIINFILAYFIPTVLAGFLGALFFKMFLQMSRKKEASAEFNAGFMFAEAQYNSLLEQHQDEKTALNALVSKHFHTRESFSEYTRGIFNYIDRTAEELYRKV